MKIRSILNFLLILLLIKILKKNQKLERNKRLRKIDFFFMIFFLIFFNDFYFIYKLEWIPDFLVMITTYLKAHKKNKAHHKKVLLEIQFSYQIVKQLVLLKCNLILIPLKKMIKNNKLLLKQKCLKNNNKHQLLSKKNLKKTL